MGGEEEVEVVEEVEAVEAVEAVEMGVDSLGGGRGLLLRGRGRGGRRGRRGRRGEGAAHCCVAISSKPISRKMSRNIARTFMSGWSEPPAGGFPAASRLSGLKAWSRHVPLTSISCVRSATALTPHDPNIAPGLTLRLLTVTACGTGGKPLSVGASWWAGAAAGRGGSQSWRGREGVGRGAAPRSGCAS